MTRDEYVKQLKTQIDQWNAEMAKWEGAAGQQLDEVRKRRDAAAAEMRRLQDASLDAWKDMMRGADSAFKAMQDSFDKAARHFERKK